MTISQYWNTEEQAWIMPVLAELHGTVEQAADWPAARGAVEAGLGQYGAGARAEALLRPLDQAVSGGSDFKALVTELVGEYHAAAATQAPSTRIDAIEPVQGYNGWWRGFDAVDQAWKYVRSETTPGDQTEGWTTQVDWAAVAPPQPAATTTAPPEPTWDDGWQMFYRVRSDGQYEFSEAVTPGDRASGCRGAWADRDEVLARRQGQTAGSPAGPEATADLQAQARAAVEAAFAERPELRESLSAEDIETIVGNLVREAAQN